MRGVAPKRSTPAGKSGRHLHLVPDDAQAALWDRGELERLARLRQLALMSGAPGEAIRVIDRATTADEAIGVLTEAGFMPTEAAAEEGLVSWFAPLLEPGCEPLDAELCGAQFIGELHRAMPPNLDVTDVLIDIIEDFAPRRSAVVLAMMRALGAVAPGPARTMAARAADQIVRDGVADMPWAADLGWPVPGRCFGYTDVYGEQRSMVLTFSYGRKPHALVVLIDYLLGGGVKDCYVTDYSESIRREYQRLGRDPDIIFIDLDPGEARRILLQSLACDACPVEPHQIRNVQNHVGLLVARAAALPAPAKQSGRAHKPAAAGGTGSGSATKRQSRPKNIHRLKVTLRGAKPPIWRRFEVPSDITLARLHRVIQTSFGWLDYHLHVFDTPVGRYGTADPDGEAYHFNDAYKKLSAVADWPGDRLRYTYDFGDNWELDIVVEAVEPAEPGVAYPLCTGGRRAGPPEDCGGVWGYADLLNVLANPEHEDHKARLGWLGIETAAEYEPDAFDVDVVNIDLVRRVLIKP